MPLSLDCINVKGAMKALEHDKIRRHIGCGERASKASGLKRRRRSRVSMTSYQTRSFGQGGSCAFIEELQSLNAIKEFSPQAWGVMVERVKLRRDGDIEFSFIDGSKVRV